jgi:hypothetical protein
MWQPSKKGNLIESSFARDMAREEKKGKEQKAQRAGRAANASPKCPVYFIESG